MAVENVDPVHADNVSMAGSENGVALIFTRALFTPTEKGIDSAQLMLSAGVRVPWPLLIQMYSVIGDLLQKRQAAIEAATETQGKPN